eukprot:TRINITY_DN31572_c1_g3_i1.p1 TRINITY_DN31572_c1_g3~~TRINITY_DN31572_c1_g3_i1.p1  ORF type:complete len:829 (-),score=228.03 TRINITY_DN31572_c1_g3_i1:145-2631(-)
MSEEDGSRISICEVGGGGIMLPLFGDAEQRWPNALRAILYFLGLGWCFLGVAVISDVFMSAIERITARKMRKLNPDTGRLVTVSVWNATVANLTLMALGSSAPEILLNVIELFGRDFYSAELGPSTIVGSAAFNLFVIIAVCVSAIPGGETRQIEEFGVYVLTAVFSIFAYLWLLLILLVFSPNVVEPWEGIVTFLYFPVLVSLAYLTDQGCFSGSGEAPKLGTRDRVVTAELSMEELAELEAKVRRMHGKELTDQQLVKLMEIEHSGPPLSRAEARAEATKVLTGARPRLTVMKMDAPNFNKVLPVDDSSRTASKTPDLNEMAFLQFACAKYAALENAGTVKLNIIRTGCLGIPATVFYKTREGTAKMTADFIHAEGQLHFMPGETMKSIEIILVDDLAYEEDEDFFVDLTLTPNQSNVRLGETPSATVIIIDDDQPGVIRFPDEQLTILQECEDKEVSIMVNRVNGCTGLVKCKYYTENDSALAGRDYEDCSGTLEFADGQSSAVISITVKANGRFDNTEMFRIFLSECSGGAKFDATTDGGESQCILTVILEVEAATKERLERIYSTLQTNWDKAKVGHRNWRDQFVEAVSVNGGEDEDEDGNPITPGALDYFMHALTLPWKVLFAFCPPVDYFGGWLCFCVSLLMIGGVTAFVSDIASLLGCVTGIRDQITAITLVALGTSLPDTFASKTAALQDPTADASICNVTGSNSVNVFLGLGLPWGLGAIYWRVRGANAEWTMRYGHKPFAQEWKDGAFVVEAGGLAFSVCVFSVCATFAIAVLYVRRLKLGGELGGPAVTKYATSALLGSLWVVYIALSCWYVFTDQ